MAVISRPLDWLVRSYLLCLQAALMYLLRKAECAIALEYDTLEGQCDLASSEQTKPMHARTSNRYRKAFDIRFLTRPL